MISGLMNFSIWMNQLKTIRYNYRINRNKSTMIREWHPQRKRIDSITALVKTHILHIGFPVSRSTIETTIEGHPDFPNISFDNLSEIYKSWGIETMSFTLEPHLLESVPLSSITFINEWDAELKVGIFVLFYGLKNQEVEYLHPRKGWVIEPLETFESKWARGVICVTGLTGNGEPDFLEKEEEYDRIKFNNPDLTKNVAVYDDFISTEDCDYLIRLSQDRFIKSMVFDSEKPLTDGRTSESAYLTIKDETIERLKQKCSELLEVPVSHFEDFQCVSYQLGQEYQNHFDTYDASTEEGRMEIEKNGQREYTILAYLNDDFEGGGTHFPRLDLVLKPKKGRVVIFKSINNNRTVIQTSIHAGLPVSNGRKYALNIWVRDKEILN